MFAKSRTSDVPAGGRSAPHSGIRIGMTAKLTAMVIPSAAGMQSASERLFEQA